MSYKTRHELICCQGNIGTQEIMEFLKEQHGPYPGDETWYDVMNRHPTGWNQRDQHLREISRNWPHAVFALDLQGEDQLETMREYHQNGASYTAHPEMPRFDHLKLRGQNGELPDDDYGNEPQAQWHPQTSILRDTSVQSVLNQVLWAMNHYRGPCPNDEELDQLAPSLKDLIMKRVWERETPACGHLREEVGELARETIQQLPPEEIRSLRNFMRKHLN